MKTAVIKATRSEAVPPKRKHVDFLVASTRSNKPNLHAILEALQARGQVQDWKVVLKVSGAVRDGLHRRDVRRRRFARRRR